jgi:hypothetical protein
MGWPGEGEERRGWSISIPVEFTRKPTLGVVQARGRHEVQIRRIDRVEPGSNGGYCPLSHQVGEVGMSGISSNATAPVAIVVDFGIARIPSGWVRDTRSDRMTGFVVPEPSDTRYR